MASKFDQTTTVSSKGQVVLPKPLRDRRHWVAGTQLIATDHPDGILLRIAPTMRTTTLADVIGCANYTGPPKSLADMERGITERAEHSAR
jgi:AbrB family looped-hinge helix DNA binding protein